MTSSCILRKTCWPTSPAMHSLSALAQSERYFSTQSYWDSVRNCTILFFLGAILSPGDLSTPVTDQWLWMSSWAECWERPAIKQPPSTRKDKWLNCFRCSSNSQGSESTSEAISSASRRQSVKARNSQSDPQASISLLNSCSSWTCSSASIPQISM